MAKQATKTNKPDLAKSLLVIVALLVGFGVGCLTAKLIADRKPSANPAESHVEEEAMSTEGAHAHAHQMIEVPAETAPSVKLTVTEDTKSGWNVHVETSNFTFTPDKAGMANVMGEGHAHLYLDGEKISRIYSNYFHLDKEFDGSKTFKVTLNANDHSEYAIDGQVIAAEQVVAHDHSQSDPHDH